MKGVKDSDHNNSVDNISLASLGQDTSKYESEPVVKEANKNNSDNPYDVEVKEEKEEPATEPELSTICPQWKSIRQS